MTDANRKLIRRIAFAAAALGLLVPISVSPSQGLQGNEACAGPSCCRELNSLCLAEGSGTIHHYQAADGLCSQQEY